MTFPGCNIDGVVIRELDRFDDERGWLVELFRSDNLPDGFVPAMSYVSSTVPGGIRGPHEHKLQADFFCIVGPSTFEVYFWDNRKNSPTYRNHFKIAAGEKKLTAILIPPGVVHGYKNIGQKDGLVFNAPDRLYAGRDKKDAVDEIRHENDPASRFKID